MDVAAVLEQIKDAVGPSGWIADPHDQEPYLIEARRLYHGATRLVVRPASTSEVAAVVRICAGPGWQSCPKAATPGWSAAGCPRMTATISSLPSAG